MQNNIQYKLILTKYRMLPGHIVYTIYTVIVVTLWSHCVLGHDGQFSNSTTTKTPLTCCHPDANKYNLATAHLEIDTDLSIVLKFQKWHPLVPERGINTLLEKEGALGDAL